MSDKLLFRRHLKRLDEATRGVQTQEQAVENFRAILKSAVGEQALGETARDRTDLHIMGFGRSQRMLDIEGVRELMFTMWVEGFLIGKSIAEEQITGERP